MEGTNGRFQEHSHYHDLKRRQPVDTGIHGHGRREDAESGHGVAQIPVPPEFLNRVDEIIIFNSLSAEHIKEIVGIQLEFLKKRMPPARSR